MPENGNERPRADTFWASALRATTDVARQASVSETEVVRAFIKEFRRLKLRGGVSLLTPDRQLEVQSRSLASAVEKALKRTTGWEINGFRFDPSDVDVYHEVMTSRKPSFTDDREGMIRQMLPDKLRPFLSPIMKILGNHNVIVAPLILDEEPIGTINVASHWLSQEDLPMVAALADHVAIALGNVRTRAEIESALEKMQLRYQVAEMVASALELPVVLERVIRLAVEVAEADAGAIGLIEPDGDTVTFPYLYKLPETLRFHPAPRGQGLIWNLIENHKPILLEDYASHPNALKEWVETGIHAILGVPLYVGEESIGGLGLFSFSEAKTFDQHKVEQVQAIASMASIAVNNAQLFAEATKRAEESQVLINTSQSISASLDLDTVLREIVEQSRDLLSADGSRIHLVDLEEGVLHCVVALDPLVESADAFNVPVGEGITGFVVESGEPQIVNDPAADPRSIQVPGTPEEELECLAIAPLSIRQRTMGAMTVRRFGLDHPFKQTDLELLAAFASQAAVAIENAHLYGQIGAQAQRLEIEVAERTRDLALSEARYRALVETSLGGIFQADPQGILVYTNQAFAEMLELSTDELLGKRAFDIDGMTPEYQTEVRERFQARMRGDRSPREVYEVEFQSQSGRRIPALVAVSVIADDDGQPQGLTGLVIDISKRKGLEAALKAERDRLDAMLTHIGDAVMVTDPAGSIRYVNPAWERLNGYSANDVMGKNPRFLRTDHHTDRFYKNMWETILDGKTWNGEVINRRKDGTTYDAALTITPVLDDRQRVINLVGVHHDISSLKELDRLKSQFVSDVSHELRTPLTNIRLYLDLMDRIREPEKVSRYLETLSRESDRLANLIDDLLSLSRLDAGATSFDATNVDVNESLQALVNDRLNLASRRGLELIFEPDQSLPQIQGDDRLLGQVFTNLLTNAMNYTPEGGQIFLSTRIEDDPEGNWVVAEVKDTGLGVPIEEQSVIFNRFSRGFASKSTGAAGTGLGLAICHEIAELHGGRISVTSEGIPGKGSSFAVWLPTFQEP